MSPTDPVDTSVENHENLTHACIELLRGMREITFFQPCCSERELPCAILRMMLACRCMRSCEERHIVKLHAFDPQYWREPR